jgi:hypothetical protein
MHHVGEQHRHLLVLRRSGGPREWRTALATELGCRAYSSPTRPTRQSVVHASIMSPLVQPSWEAMFGPADTPAG